MSTAKGSATHRLFRPPEPSGPPGPPGRRSRRPGRDRRCTRECPRRRTEPPQRPGSGARAGGDHGGHVPKALHALRDSHTVREAVVLSTCNRVEVFADVDKFHGGVGEISDLLATISGLPLEALSEYLYVHYEDRAVQHLFTVACGLDSMVVGEAQILGQLRSAYGVARREAATGRVLHEMFQHALRVGKRARTETGIDRAGASLVALGLETCSAALGSLAGRSVEVRGQAGLGHH